ncbi:MAG: 3-oxoadipate enol-lactonase [Thermoleophilaceae bacterium]|nr:3-oxoadipate enol-lactonase [Thermoleophilaceae bacterium]
MNAPALHHVADGPADGRPLLMIGSLGTTLAMWEPQLEELTARRRVVRCDLPGHGASPAPGPELTIARIGSALLRTADALGIGRFDLVGLSLGGMTSMWVAAHAPDRVRRLALLCTSAGMGPPSAWRERAAAVRAEGVEAVVPGVRERWFTPGADPALIARYEDMLRTIDAEAYASCCEAIGTHDARPWLGQIEAPTLALAGAEDPSTPPSALAELRDAIPGAHLTVVDGAAHLASVEQPAAVDAALIEHLEATE